MNPLNFANEYRAVINFIGINALLGVSLYVALSAGLLSLANAGFMAIGAYTSVLLTLERGWPYPAALLAGALLAAVLALPLGIPVLRLRGVFLAIATIGFGEVVRVLLNTATFTKGALGLPNIPEKTDTWQIYLSLALLLVVLLRLRRTRMGYALEAIKQDEAAARTMGINTTYYKVLAFVLSAFIAGWAGALDAHLVRSISPSTYGFTRAVDTLTYAVVGGMASPWGPVLGALLFTTLPEILRTDLVRGWQFFGYRIEPGADTLIATGLVLLLVILFLPRGLITLFESARNRLVSVRSQHRP